MLCGITISLTINVRFCTTSYCIISKSLVHNTLSVFYTYKHSQRLTINAIYTTVILYKDCQYHKIIKAIVAKSSTQKEYSIVSHDRMSVLCIVHLLASILFHHNTRRFDNSDGVNNQSTSTL